MSDFLQPPPSEKNFDRRAAQTELTLRKVFGQAVRAIRDQKRLTQRTLAGHVGISREQIVAIENGRSGLSEKVIAKMLVAFGLSLGEFLEIVALNALMWDEGQRAILTQIASSPTFLESLARRDRR